MRFRMLVLASAALIGAIGPASAEKIKIGVTPGPHAQIFEVVKPIAAKKGLEIEILEFSDYVVPNEALSAGDLQANSFQNQPFLDNQKADRGYKIESVALTVNFPLGIYSKKHKSWDQVPDGGKIAIQNDPTNGGRSLLLLQDKGVIKLKAGVGFKPTVLDIVDDPKKLQFIEVEAAQTPRALDKVPSRPITPYWSHAAGPSAGSHGKIEKRGAGGLLSAWAALQ